MTDNPTEAERVEFAARALRLEAALQAMRVERDYWRELVLRKRELRKRWDAERRAKLRAQP